MNKLTSLPVHVCSYVLSDPPTGVTLQLTSGSKGANVSEGDAVTFACSGSGGQPTPTVTVVSKDSGVQLATGPSPLNHEENNVRCEDGGDYTCSADNRMGQPATTTATLYVNCKNGQFINSVKSTLKHGQ